MSAEGLTDAERKVVLTPCECGHTLNDHGSLAGCWTCPEVGNPYCDVTGEQLLLRGVERIVAARLTDHAPECCPACAGDVFTPRPTHPTDDGDAR